MINPDEINAAVGLVSTVMPQVMAAYSLFKIIWQHTNPGKTEADFFAYLEQASQKNIDESDAILREHGYEPDGNGGYRKVVAPGPTSSQA